MNKKISFVFISKDEKFLMSRLDTDAITTKYPNITFNYVQNNDNNLPSVYNFFIDTTKNTDIDYLIFCHADIKFDVLHLCDHIESCGDKYDLFGLCGCKKMVVSESPLNWFCGSKQFPESRFGYVRHGELNNSVSYWSDKFPYINDTYVACIDGLMIGFNKKALNTIRFDELFKFDFYDTDISLQAVKNHLNIGCLVEKSLQHFSVGRGILSDSFLKQELIFRKKWHLSIPQSLKNKLHLS